MSLSSFLSLGPPVTWPALASRGGRPATSAPQVPAIPDVVGGTPGLWALQGLIMATAGVFKGGCFDGFLRSAGSHLFKVHMVTFRYFCFLPVREG